MNKKTLKLKTGNENSVIIIILAVLLVVVLAIVGVYIAKENKGIATFDGGSVKKSEYEIYYKMFSPYLQYYGYGSNEIPYEILIRAAQDKMIVSEAKAAGVELTDENKQELDSTFNDESAVEQFKTAGYDIDELRQLYINDYLIQNYLEKRATELDADTVKEYILSKYTDEEPDMYEYDTSHILFSFTKDDNTTMSDDEKAELKKKAEEVLARAKAGEDFAALAQEFSDDSTASDGGKYTMYMDGSTVEEYADAVTSLKVGEIYPSLVESTYGYHIIKLNDKVENGRVNNTYERSEYVNSLYTDIQNQKNFKVNVKDFREFVMELAAGTYTKAEEISVGEFTPEEEQNVTDSTDNTDSANTDTTGE